MARLIRGVAAVAALCCAAGGCANLPSMTDDVYPVYGNPVNPTPVSGYRVICRSVPNVTNFIFDDVSTGCRQVIVPAEVVIRVRG